MTRLKESDIHHISKGLSAYNRELSAKTGQSLPGIACRAWEADESITASKLTSSLIYVIPVTAGQGIISKFSETIAAILNFLGCDARVTDLPDASGMAAAFENNADAVMMADDNRFVGINLNTKTVVDNADATGRVFAAALDLLAGGIRGMDALVMGCGPVGDAGAGKLLSLGARVFLFDTCPDAAHALKARLLNDWGDNSPLAVEKDLNAGLAHCRNILEATPSSFSIPDTLLSGNMRMAAPGVPLGISTTGCHILKDSLIHDTLELGVAAMAVGLFK